MKLRRRVYIAGPIVKGDLRNNIEQANVAAFALMAADIAPLCPHWSCFSGYISRNADGEYWAKAEVLPRESPIHYWYDTDLAWVAASEALLRLPGEGTGSDKEVAFALSLGIPVFYSAEDVIAWANK